MTDSPIVKKLMWSGLVTLLASGASILATKLAGVIWKRAFDEDPPE